MKTITLILLLIPLFFGCKVQEEQQNIEQPNKEPQQDVFETPYYSHTEFRTFENFEVASDTLIHVGNFHPQYSLLELKKGDNHIILLNKFSIEDTEGFVHDLHTQKRIILDSLHLGNLKPNELVITGCCTENEKHPEEIIAIIEKTGNLYAEKVTRAWRANLEKDKIEEIYDLSRVKCVNKHHKVEITENGF